MTRHLPWAWALLLTACVGSTLPQPPNLAPVDPSRIWTTNEERKALQIVGLPGAAAPNLDVWGWDLETADAPVVTRSEADGSFALGLPSTGRVRLQLRRGAEVSEPLDLWDLSPVDYPECIRLPRLLSLGSAREGEIVLRNDCAETLRLETITLRFGEPDILPPPVTRAALDPGAEMVLRFRVRGEASVEDIAFAELLLGTETVQVPISILALNL